MANSRALTSCTELADLLGALPMLLREGRRQRGLSLRDAAAQIGVGFNAVTRIEHGHETTVSTAVAILRWLDLREVGSGG